MNFKEIFLSILDEHRDWQIIASIFEGVAILIAAFIAQQTFRAWRRQRAHERKMQVAERSLVAVYKAERAIRSIRSLIGYVPQKYIDEDSGTAQMRAYIDGLNAQRPAFDDLLEGLPLARAYFGEHGFSLLAAFLNLRHEIQIAAEDQLSEVQRRGPSVEWSEDTRLHDQEMKSVLRGLFNEKDEFGQRVITTRSEAEDLFLPSIRP